MYAIIKDSGKQYKVESGKIVDVELKSKNPGDEVVFEEVVAISGDDGLKCGTPTVSGAKVIGFVEKDVRAKKVVGRKFRRRKDSTVKRGHVQQYTRVRIKEIVVA